MIARLRVVNFWLRLIVYILPLVTLLAAVGVLYSVAPAIVANMDARSFLILAGLESLIWIASAETTELSSVIKLYRERTGIRAALTSSLTTVLVLVSLLYFLRIVEVPRTLLIISLTFLLAAAFAVRTTFRILIWRYRGRPVRVLVIGADDFAVRAANRLELAPISPCKVVGFVRLEHQTAAAEASAVRDFSDLERICPDDIDDVVIALPFSEFHRMNSVIQQVERFYLPTHAIVDTGEGLIIRDKLYQFGRLQMLDLACTPADSWDYTILKKIFDIVFSLFVLVITSPLFLLIAIAIKLTDRGPVFFSQERVGLNGRLFLMLKFRTMSVQEKAESDTQWTVAEDPRRTAIGSILRSLSLDELPQFLNVIKGDMSVVGPRPERPYFVRKFLEQFAEYSSRHRLKVGITGWAQVNGWRGDTCIQKRIEHDLYYLQNWSMYLDLRIIIMTLFGGALNKNAY